MLQDPTNSSTNIDPETQKMLNQPTVDPNGFSPEVLEFITSTMQLVFDGKIDLDVPATIINQEIYQNSSEEAQGNADIVAINLCKKLRDIRDLMHLSGGDALHITPTYQANLLVQDLKYRKEEFETKWGDLFLI